ncbi:hypothetical protein GJU39_00175 [Pedobacter petrophilus]|uniref:Uncharacterized protein n=1 Tax=Pedobacter petrophilus TaxID=1908241 RepID=A0A7K0FS98_9SPHI|nr:hypothetical protein [Pedobacter petrophilus]MRX74487.1 hypothetical protein [Pedobacter petrophilus]
MIEKQQIKPDQHVSIFEEEFLKKIPVFYRYMILTDTASIGEMYADTRFSQSAKHFSREYIQYTPVNPYSNILIEEKTDDQ